MRRLPMPPLHRSYLPEQPGVEAGTHFGGCGFGPLLSASAGAAEARTNRTVRRSSTNFLITGPPFSPPKEDRNSPIVTRDTATFEGAEALRATEPHDRRGRPSRVGSRRAWLAVPAA